MLVQRIIFCLGSNLGDRLFYLREATKLLQLKLELKNLKQSQVLENKALLLPNSPKEWDINFYNIAISADIDLQKFSAQKILEIIQKIELELGKVYIDKWAPRKIDIDIVAISDLKIDLGDVLQVPHKELFNRDFFLKTIGEIEPEILEKLYHFQS